MHAIEPDMVLGKPVVDARGGDLGDVVDVGLYSHSRVKFLVVEGRDGGAPARRLMVDEIDAVSPTTVRVRVQA